MAITHRIVKAQLVNHRFQIIEPQLGNEFRAAARAFGLRHFARALLIKLNADRGRPLNDVKELAERQIKERHDHRRLMRQRDEVIHVAVQPKTRCRQHQPVTEIAIKQHMRNEVERELL